MSGSPSSIHRRTALKFMAATTAALGAPGIPLLARAATVGPREMVEPAAGAWRTWFLTTGANLRQPPPPDSLGELPQVRGAVAAVNTTMLDGIAFWDAGAPPYRWNELATAAAGDGDGLP